jgi:hypothetical protein
MARRHSEEAARKRLRIRPTTSYWVPGVWERAIDVTKKTFDILLGKLRDCKHHHRVTGRRPSVLHDFPVVMQVQENSSPAFGRRYIRSLRFLPVRRPDIVSVRDTAWQRGRQARVSRRLGFVGERPLTRMLIGSCPLVCPNLDTLSLLSRCCHCPDLLRSQVDDTITEDSPRLRETDIREKPSQW